LSPGPVQTWYTAGDHDGPIGRQIQVDARCAALVSILKALAMSTLTQRIDHAADPGYWAVEIRLDEAAGRGKRYLCHAENNRKAFGMAVRIAGAVHDFRGFNYFWIDEDRLEVSEPELPMMGGYGEVSDVRKWGRLMDAHQASEAALAGRQADAAA
jgi:hypothetical protein